MTKIEVTDADKEKLRVIHDDFVGDTIGVLQAIGGLTREMERLKGLLSSMEYEKASRLGYTQLSTEFIFLQRCLGGLQKTFYDQCAVTQDLARAHNLSFEDVEPDVKNVMMSFLASSK